ncbi:MAG: hypothetical protein C0432_02515 [Candidatus Puniceispirillum sp.]|nr:hypothetical protein [Candidatus Pelagibacter sp.]MBA4283148.1 hypothetical protein [Candidatus Puniceispirillum sp.]
MITELSYHWIDSVEKANTVLEELSEVQTEYLFCDTEFIRIKDSLPTLQLIQITYDPFEKSEESKIYIIDCQQESVQESLKNFFLKTKKTFVFHSVRQDLEGIFQSIGLFPYAFFDLQVASSFLGFGLSIGLSELAEHYLDVIVDKSLQHSQWNNRPLSAHQIAYAANDVYYIQKIFPKIQDELKNLGRYEWCRAYHREYEKNLHNILIGEKTRLEPMRLDSTHRQKFFDCKKSIQKISHDISIPLSILASNDMIQSFVLDSENPLHPFHQSWRSQILKEILKQYTNI